MDCIFPNLCYNGTANGATAPERRSKVMTEDFDLTQTDDMTAKATQRPSSENIRPYDDTQETGMTGKQKIILVSIGVAVLLGLIGLIIGLVLFSGRNNEDDRILENVFAGGIELSGMTVEEAISALHLATDHSVSKEPMVIQIYDDNLILLPEDTKVSLDVEAVAQTAYNYGRSGNHAENQQIQKNANKRSYTIPLLPYLNLDLNFIRSTVDSYCTTIDSEYSEPVISLEGNRPSYEAEGSVRHQTLRITLGTPLRRLDANDLYDRILDAYSMNQLQLQYETPEVLWPSEVQAWQLYNEYCTPAQDAVLDTTTYTVKPEVYGYGFDVYELQQLLDEADPGEEVEINLSFLYPKVFAQDINDSLYVEKLSEYSITSTAAHTGRDTNLQLSCAAINGYIIKPGETFSFKNVLGTVSAETGYSDAPICAVNDTAMGGGISQTASALYYCVLHADLEIVERHHHTYATDFIELGMDAYVDGSSKDLRFKNNTSAPIRIEAKVSGHTVSISLHGSNSLDYAVSLRTEISETKLPITTYQMLLPSSSKGYKEGDVIVKGIEGYQVSVKMEKTDLSTGNLLTTVSVSNNDYKKRDEIIARIGDFPEDDEEIEQDPTEPTTELQ